LQNPNYVCISVCGYTYLDICQLNALLQQQQTDQLSGVANAHA